MSSVRLFVCVLFLAAPLAAQFPYGFGTPGAGLFVPRLDAGRLVSGNASFGFTIADGTGGSTAFFAISALPADQMIGTTPIWVNVDPAFLLDFRTLTLGGSIGTPGTGTAFLPTPVAFPPFLAGLDVYAQAIVLDAATGVAAATNGLRVELALPERVFVGTSVAGSNDPTWVVDPASATVEVAATSGTNNVSGGVMGSGGQRIYASTSLGNQIAELDMTTTSPSWQTFWAAGGVCYELGFDGINDILYTISDGPTGSRELVALDANPTSPTYGSVLRTTSGLSAFGVVEPFALSPSGRLAAVWTLFSPVLFLVDTDPASPNWMTIQNLGPIPTPPTSAFTVPTSAVFTPDDQMLIVPLQLAGPVPGAVARYSFLLQGWVDHDPATPLVDPIGLTSVPRGTVPSAPTDIDVSDDGTFAIISGFGAGGSLVRLDVEASNPFTWSTTQIATGLPGAWDCALISDDTEAAVGTFGSGPASLRLIDLGTGLERAAVPLPGASNVYTVTGG